MPRKASNRVKTNIDVYLSDSERLKAFRWLNIQHIGKPMIPWDAECSEEHKNAGYKACRTKRIEVELEFSKDGDFKIVKVGKRKVV